MAQSRVKAAKVDKKVNLKKEIKKEEEFRSSAIKFALSIINITAVQRNKECQQKYIFLLLLQAPELLVSLP